MTDIYNIEKPFGLLDGSVSDAILMMGATDYHLPPKPSEEKR